MPDPHPESRKKSSYTQSLRSSQPFQSLVALFLAQHNGGGQRAPLASLKHQEQTPEKRGGK
jgi:hypothetical protein